MSACVGLREASLLPPVPHERALLAIGRAVPATEAGVLADCEELQQSSRVARSAWQARARQGRVGSLLSGSRIGSRTADIVQADRRPRIGRIC